MVTVLYTADSRRQCFCSVTEPFHFHGLAKQSLSVAHEGGHGSVLQGRSGRRGIIVWKVGSLSSILEDGCCRYRAQGGFRYVLFFCRTVAVGRGQHVASDMIIWS